MIGTVTVNPSIDQHILIDRLIKDDVNRAREIRRDPGGKGINVSRVIKELGGETVAFGVFGGCAGYMLKSLMAEHGIAFEPIEVQEETRINVILTDRSDRTQTQVNAAGPRLALSEMEQLIVKITQHEPFPEWCVLGGSLPPGVPADFYARLIDALQRRGTRCLLDADDEALRIGLQSKPYLIKPNEHEFSRLVGRPLADDETLIQSAQEMVDQGIQVVAVTLGGKGALIATQGRVFRATTPPVEVKSKVGAGDSFLAGCVLALSRGQSLEEAIRLGMAAGTAAVMNAGTQLCRRQDVEKVMPHIGIDPVGLGRSTVSTPRAQKMRDIVYGMEIDPTVAAFSAMYRGSAYRFCSLRCRQRFEADPPRFLS